MMAQSSATGAMPPKTNLHGGVRLVRPVWLAGLARSVGLVGHDGLVRPVPPLTTKLFSINCVFAIDFF